MSVVNRMLRDLDRREAGEEHTIYTQQLHSGSGSSMRRASPLAVLLGVVALAALGFGVWQYFGVPPWTPHPAPVAPPSPAPRIEPATAPPVITQSDAPPAGSDDAPDATPEPATPPAIDTPSARDDAAPSHPPAPATATAGAPPAPAHAAPTAGSGSRSNVATPAAGTPRTPEHMRASGPSAQRGATSREAQRGDGTPAKIDVRPHTPAVRTAEGEFRRAAALITQGRHEEARTALRAALDLDPAHEGARQTLAVLLVEAQQTDGAMALLVEGLRRNPAQTNFAIVLARLKFDQGDNAGALQVLREHGGAATSNAEYRAFTAALLQRAGHAEEAIAEYRAALALAPNAGVWWAGLAMAHEAAGQTREAIEAYRHAHVLGGLPPAMSELVHRKLQTLH